MASEERAWAAGSRPVKRRRKTVVATSLRGEEMAVMGDGAEAEKQQDLPAQDGDSDGMDMHTGQVSPGKCSSSVYLWGNRYSDTSLC